LISTNAINIMIEAQVQQQYKLARMKNIRRGGDGEVVLFLGMAADLTHVSDQMQPDCLLGAGGRRARGDCVGKRLKRWTIG
jgi:hypothetical protein